ncbi:MAG: hypothetical protein Q4F35_03200 [Akkermansia sp.]|nr:hypothetical protein [Akkermansia sp.]
MFHVEQVLICSVAATTLLAAAEPTAAPAPSPAPIVQLPLATNNVAANQFMQAGMVDLLLGWEESARVHFEKAVVADEMCSLAYVGLMMTEPDVQKRAESLAALSERISTLPTTPVEAFYLSTFLKLIGNDHLGAAEDFCRRAERFRRDTFSACWGILLLHSADLGYDEQGKPLRLQERALELAEKLYAQYPENALVCFVRAYVEEAAPVVSEKALQAAMKAVELLPEHPIPAHLLGHLYYRSGQAEKSIPHFIKAVQAATGKGIPEWESAVLMTSRLYVSTAMWSAGMDSRALATRRAMNAMPLDREHLHAPAVILQRWEAATLPLRVLVMRPDTPTPGEITAAAKAAEVKPALPGDDPVLLVRDCLRAALYARLRAAKKDAEYAARSLKLAEDALHRYEQTREATLAAGVHYITPWMRALEACQIAINIAKAEFYAQTSEIWRENAHRAVRPVTLMLPPVIPQRSSALSQ